MPSVGAALPLLRLLAIVWSIQAADCDGGSKATSAQVEGFDIASSACGADVTRGAGSSANAAVVKSTEPAAAADQAAHKAAGTASVAAEAAAAAGAAAAAAVSMAAKAAEAASNAAALAADAGGAATAAVAVDVGYPRAAQL